MRTSAQRTTETIAETFRPGHADYTYWQKYGIRDYRGGGRSSARETAVRVAAAAVARKWLRRDDTVSSSAAISLSLEPKSIRFQETGTAVNAQPVLRRRCRTVVPELESFMDSLRKSGDSCGAQDHRGCRACAGRAGAARSTTSSTPIWPTR